MRLQVSFLLCSLFVALVVCQENREEFLQRLVDLTEEEQATETRPFRSLLQWQTIEGQHKNYAFFNTHGTCEQANARHTVLIPDVNSFIPGYVAMQLFDAYRFGNAPKASKLQINRIVKLVDTFHDKNRPGTAVMTFYPQAYNESVDFWYINPINVIEALNNLEKILPIDLPTLLLGPAPLPDDFAGVFSVKRFNERIRCPPDFDSSSVHLGFGSMLYEVRDQYPEAWQQWKEDNPNLKSFFENVKKYAYRPFSSDRNENSIDPRGYYIMRPFIERAKRENRDIAVLPTWVQNTEELRSEYYKGVVSAWGVNTIDITVHANFIAGSFLAFSNGLVDADVLLEDPDLQLIIGSTGSLIVEGLRTNLTNRYDLALLYYPPLMQFYWFVGRCLMYIEKERLKGPLIAPVFETFYQELLPVMLTITTADILSKAQVDPAGGFYYDDFLGNADTSYYGKPINRAEDRVYTTSMAANALLYIWSVYDDSEQKLAWRENTPELVKTYIRGCTQWLERNTLSGQYRLTNPFFGLDFKNRESVIYFYPANRFEYLNGTKIDNGFTFLPDEPTVYAMEGYVEPEEYEHLLKMDKFGQPTPLTFQGFNEGQGATVLWTADALTYGGVLTAVSMLAQLE